MTPDEEDETCRRADTGATTRRHPRIRRAPVSESTGAGLGGKFGGEMGNVVIDISMSLDGHIAGPMTIRSSGRARTA
jgi:hypothetical protein